jgi:hypothetical protein
MRANQAVHVDVYASYRTTFGKLRMRSCADECVYMYMCMNGHQRVGGRLSSVNVPNSPCAYDTSKHATVEDERKIAEHTTVARRENPTRRTQSRAFKIPRRLVKVSMEWVFLLSPHLQWVNHGLDTTNLTTRQCNGKNPSRAILSTPVVLYPTPLC